MHELGKTRYEGIRPLVSELANYNVAILALLDGINPGRIFVNDLENPSAAYIETVEGRHLVGVSIRDTFTSALQTHFDANMPDWGIAVTVDPDSWVNSLANIFHPRPVRQMTRRHYVCTKLAYTNWRERLPDGFVVRPIDSNLLDNEALDIPDHILNWIKYNWGTRAHYEQYGFGFARYTSSRL